MQLISAIVRPTKVSEICHAMKRLGFHGVTVTDATGLGKLRGPTEIYRGAKYIRVPPARQARAPRPRRGRPRHDRAHLRLAFTSRMGDGKVWITTVDELVRIRTREVGADAL
jgi:nitrogen regulatory protein P-II 1